MKALALVVSARRRGNCYDMARFVLDRLEAAGVETELVRPRIAGCNEEPLHLRGALP